MMHFDGDWDAAVVRDARSQLEKAARLLAKLEGVDTATSASQQRAAALLSEALANIHAAEESLVGSPNQNWRV